MKYKVEKGKREISFKEVVVPFWCEIDIVIFDKYIGIKMETCYGVENLILEQKQCDTYLSTKALTKQKDPKMICTLFFAAVT